MFFLVVVVVFLLVVVVVVCFFCVCFDVLFIFPKSKDLSLVIQFHLPSEGVYLGCLGWDTSGRRRGSKHLRNLLFFAISLRVSTLTLL